MRSIIAAAMFMLAALAAFSTPTLAQATSEADKSAIQSTIRNQLEAFKRDDGAAAYSFAAPNVQAVFPTVDSFMAMVKLGYQPVYRPQSYAFRDLEVMDGRLSQTVEIVGPDNEFWTAVYTVEKQPDGVWRITGCRIIKTPGGSA